MYNKKLKVKTSKHQKTLPGLTERTSLLACFTKKAYLDRNILNNHSPLQTFNLEMQKQIQNTNNNDHNQKNTMRYSVGVIITILSVICCDSPFQYNS